MWRKLIHFFSKRCKIDHKATQPKRMACIFLNVHILSHLIIIMENAFATNSLQ